MVELPRLVFDGIEEKCRAWLMAERKEERLLTNHHTASLLPTTKQGLAARLTCGRFRILWYILWLLPEQWNIWENMLRMRPNTHVVSISELKIWENWKTGYPWVVYWRLTKFSQPAQNGGNGLVQVQKG
jgi:hypothetical protein